MMTEGQELKVVASGTGRPATAAERLRAKADDVIRMTVDNATKRIMVKLEEAASAGKFETQIYLTDSEVPHATTIVNWLHSEGFKASHHDPLARRLTAGYHNIGSTERHIIKVSW